MTMKKEKEKKIEIIVVVAVFRRIGEYIFLDLLFCQPHQQLFVQSSLSNWIFCPINRTGSPQDEKKEKKKREEEEENNENKN